MGSAGWSCSAEEGGDRSTLRQWQWDGEEEWFLKLNGKQSWQNRMPEWARGMKESWRMTLA